jgi:glycosyltransferase involved in cell wall biosynthesis
MRIVQINSHYDQGGAAKIVAYIHRQLLSMEQEAYVAYGRGQKSQDAHTMRFASSVSVYISAFISRFLGIHGWSNRRDTRKLLAYLDQIRPDVIHLHAIHGYYVNIPMLFSYINERNIPCVWTFHDCYAFTGNCGYYFTCERWQSGCGNCHHLKAYPRSEWFDFTAWLWKRKKSLFTKGHKIIVSPSQWLTEEAKRSFFQQYPCVTINNGIDTTGTFYPRDKAKCRSKYGYAETDHLVLGIAVGYDDVRKGAKYIIQLAKDLGDEIKIILIGWNPKNDNMLKGTDNIQTLPPILDPSQLAEYYSLADVFLLPSLAENYATVSLEAMACGTPVVGFKVGGVPEQLADGRGIAVEAGDGQAFRDAVLEVLHGERDLPERNELSAYITEHNSIIAMTKQYKALYQDITDQK